MASEWVAVARAASPDGPVPIVATTFAQPERRGGTDTPAAGGERGAIDELRLEAQALFAERRLDELVRRVDGRLLAKLQIEPLPEAGLTRLMAYRQFGVLFHRLGRVEGPEREVLAWLLSGSETAALFETLTLAIGPTDDPQAVLGILTRLYTDHGRSVAQFPELATALAVVYDAAADLPGESASASDPAVASRLFGYYLRARRSLRVDTPTLPWPLAVFVVLNEVDEADLPWALRQFAGRQNLRDLYLDLALVEGSGTNAAVRGRESRAAPTRLRQIAARGGDSRERALYAVSVARALGLPATVVLEAADTGRVLGWPALLELRRGRWTFDTDTQRFPELRGFGGQAIDPQTFSVISSAELSILPQLLTTRPADRQLALAWVRLAMAERFDDRFGSARGHDDLGRRPARRDWLVSTDPGGAETLPRGPDHRRRLELVLAAAGRSPGCRQAWSALREMGRRGEIEEEGVELAMARTGQLLAQTYPDFALDVLTDVVAFRGTREQLTLLDRTRRWFAGHAATLIRLHLRRADLLAESGRVAEALTHYAEILEVASDAGPAAVEAMDRVEKILRDQGDLNRLVSVYRQAWTNMAVPVTGSESARSTNWYRLGERYANLLDELGRPVQARQVRQRLEVLERTGVQRGRP